MVDVAPRLRVANTNEWSEKTGSFASGGVNEAAVGHRVDLLLLRLNDVGEMERVTL
jgi:hypothetical protein